MKKIIRFNILIIIMVVLLSSFGDVLVKAEELSQRFISHKKFFYAVKDAKDKFSQDNEISTLDLHKIENYMDYIVLGKDITLESISIDQGLKVCLTYKDNAVSGLYDTDIILTSCPSNYLTNDEYVNDYFEQSKENEYIEKKEINGIQRIVTSTDYAAKIYHWIQDGMEVSLVLGNEIAKKHDIDNFFNIEKINIIQKIKTAKPSKPSIKSVKKLKKGKLKVVLKSKKNVSGYIVKCSLNKKFKKKTITLKTKKSNAVVKLSRIKKWTIDKKCYLKVRSFNKFKDLKTKYSNWSKVKIVK